LEVQALFTGGISTTMPVEPGVIDANVPQMFWFQPENYLTLQAFFVK
jgi:hypothetical protein